MTRGIRAAFQIVFSELFSLGALLGLLGWLGRAIYGERLATVTLFYPANSRYIENVTFHWYARRAKWRPTFGGFFVTPMGCGFIFAIGALEEEFTHPDNRQQLLQVYEAMEKISGKLRVASAAYSGVLPSVLSRSGVSREPIELVRTAHWIGKATEAVLESCGMPANSPIVVLGAAGYLGRRVVRIIQEGDANRPVWEIDPAHPNPDCSGRDVLDRLRGLPVLLVNVSRRDVLESYIDALWPQLVVLNEVYPECSPEGLKRLKGKGVRYFHIQGVLGWSLPKFPGAYRGAVPCCAASAANAHDDFGAYRAQLKLLEK